MKKNCIKKLLAMAIALSLVLGTNVTAFAASSLCNFDFEQTELKLAPGDVCDFSLFVDDTIKGHNTYSTYVVGQTSKSTYVWSDWKVGFSNLEIHIGSDEQAKKITLYFYIDETGIYDSVNITIVSPDKSYVKDIRDKKAKEDAKKAAAAKANTTPVYTFTYDEAVAILATAPKTLEEISLLPSDEQWKLYYAALAYQQK